MKLETFRDIDRVYVFKGTELVGQITRTKNGSTFEYDPTYLGSAKRHRLDEVAFNLPLSQSRYETRGDNLDPFFAGLLPEGLRLKALVSALKTSADDLFSLLVASGTECIGDVFVAIEPKIPDHSELPEPEDLESTSFYGLFQRSTGATDYSARLLDPSVPGVHPKISAAMISFPLALKQRNKRYLLKLGSAEFPLLVENEHFFMQLAQSCGLEAAKTVIVHDKDGVPGLLVERFDRVFDKQRRTLTRLHQEDACQFLGRYPQDKYRLSMREIAEGIALYSASPQIDILRLLAIKAFSYIIGNGDLHAKNISLLAEPLSRRVRLAPIYDMLTTIPYGDQQMALQFQGRRSKLKGGDFIEFGRIFEIRVPAIRSMLQSLCTQIGPWSERIEEIGFDPRKTEFIRRTMLQRLDDILNSS